MGKPFAECDAKENERETEMTFRWLTILLLLGTLCPRAALARPQAGSAPVIRAESKEVAVPTIVYYTRDAHPVPGLSVSDFHLFEDGQEQKIQKVWVERLYNRDLRDNFGVKERESARTPGQKWIVLKETPGFAYTFDFYLLSYVPPHSVEGSCHQINVKVDRKDVAVLARGEYCHTGHSRSDPLDGTKFSKQMEDDAASAHAGKIRVSLQAGFFYRDAKTARVYITVEFPSDAIDFREDPNGLRYEIAVLAMIYRRDGTLVARSSDIQEDDGPLNENTRKMPERYALIRALMPNHHEAQMVLHPGDYDLRVVLSDGSTFGRVQVPLTVDSYDGQQLAVSSIALCKQFHDRRQTLLDPGLYRSWAWFYKAETPPSTLSLIDTPPSTLSDFVPLVSKGLEFTPAGDTSFGKDDSLFAYYEVYESLLAGMPGTAVQTRLRIINTETDELKMDSGLQSAASWMQTGNPVIPIAQKVAIDKLTKGSYRMEVQASDSAGRSTAWRTASFTIQ